MEMILVRHGARLAGLGGSATGLSGHGCHQIRLLARALGHRTGEIDCCLSSRSDHAQETAGLLQEKVGTTAAVVVPLDCLTPRSGPGDVDTLLDQAHAAVDGLDHLQRILVVGHEGRLSDLLTELTGHRSRPFDHGEAVCVSGECLGDLARGHGEIRFRCPTVDHQEEPLRSKVQSKMTVSTFLAGFVFTALSAVLLLGEDKWTVPQIVAVIALTVSLTLFISCVYIFDQLSMPAGFWTDAGKPPRAWQWVYERAEQQREERWHAIASTAGEDVADEDLAPARKDGPRYHLMISTSRFLFTPGSWFALAGFAALLLGTGDPFMIAGGGLALVTAGAYALTRRPELGAD